MQEFSNDDLLHMRLCYVDYGLFLNVVLACSGIRDRLLWVALAALTSIRLCSQSPQSWLIPGFSSSLFSIFLIYWMHLACMLFSNRLSYWVRIFLKRRAGVFYKCGCNLDSTMAGTIRTAHRKGHACKTQPSLSAVLAWAVPSLHHTHTQSWL